MRNNEVYGDMTAWIAAHAGDNESDLMRLKRNLRLAREEELTARHARAAAPAVRGKHDRHGDRRGHRAGQVHGVAHALPRAEKALQVPPLWAIIKR